MSSPRRTVESPNLINNSCFINVNHSHTTTKTQYVHITFVVQNVMIWLYLHTTHTSDVQDAPAEETNPMITRTGQTAHITPVHEPLDESTTRDRVKAIPCINIVNTCIRKYSVCNDVHRPSCTMYVTWYNHGQAFRTHATTSLNYYRIIYEARKFKEVFESLPEELRESFENSTTRSARTRIINNSIQREDNQLCIRTSDDSAIMKEIHTFKKRNYRKVEVGGVKLQTLLRYGINTCMLTPQHVYQVFVNMYLIPCQTFALCTEV